MWSRSSLRAVDYQTRKSRWEHDLGPGHNWASVLSTAGGLVFTGDNHGNMLALDANTGETLWHGSGGGAVQGAPITYELDGGQYVLFGSNQCLVCVGAAGKALTASSGANKRERPLRRSHHI